MTLYECWTCRSQIVIIDDCEYVIITGIDKKNRLVKVVPEGKKIPRYCTPDRLKKGLLEK